MEIESEKYSIKKLQKYVVTIRNYKYIYHLSLLVETLIFGLEQRIKDLKKNSELKGETL